MVKISERVSKILPSGTLAMTQKARELKASGKDIISLSIGEPNFNTPEKITKAAIESLLKHETDHYTPTLGLDALKQAISDFHLRKDGVKVDKQQVAVFAGAKFALYSVFQTLIDPGEEVLVPVPYWVSYAEQITLAQGVPVFVKTSEENAFKLTVDLLEKAVTDKTKLLILNSPSNPTGLTYSREELYEISQWALNHQVFVIADEIYYELVHDVPSISVASLSEEIQNNTLVINGLSKSVAMTGWRLGYAFGPVEVIRALNDLTSHTTSNPAAVVQFAAIRAFQEDLQEDKEAMRRQFQKRIELFHALIQEIPGMSCVKPGGAFYLFVNIQEAMKIVGVETSDAFALKLLEEVGVATVSGENFGCTGYLRLSCASSEEELKNAAQRMNQFVRNYL